MMRRRVMRRAVVRTAVVGGTAYAVGHHAATKSAQQQQMDAQQNAQIADMQDQQAAQPVYQQAPPPAYQQPAYAPPPQAAAPAPSTGLSTDDISQLKQLGQLHESGVLTDAEFEAAKAKILGI
ncbi:MAG: SHOCT domain-containing protein [Ktedonobacteraceae bacterium]